MAIFAMGMAVPAQAQQSEAPPASAPSSGSGRTIDFRLPPADDGRAPGVQGPADNGLPPLAPGERGGTPAPTPQPSVPRVVPTQPPAASAAPAPAAEGARTPREAAPRLAEPRAAERPATSAASAPGSLSGAAAPPQPVTDAPAENASAASSVPGPATDASAPATPAGSEGGAPLWAWLLAALAALGAELWYWRRRPVPAGDGPAELAEMPESPPAPMPEPSPAPRAATPPAAPTPASAAPAPSPMPAPHVASPLVTRPVDEQRALVAMTLEIHDIRLTDEQAVVAFSLHLVNRGPVAATGLMVRIAMGQGSAMPEAVLARFFDGAGGSVLRDDIALAPGAGERLSTDAMLPRAMIEPLMIGGRPMLVPVLALDVTYHWDGPGEAFGQCAGSFVLGREQGDGGGRLAPVPLDRAAHRVQAPGHRATAMRREQ
jgi:hypothetical protein